MPILANHRHEQFAQRVASGESATAAYRAIYKASGGAAEAHGCRLVRNGKVSARIAEMQQASASQGVMTLREKREFLALIVRTPIGKVDENSPLCQYYRRTTGRRAVLHIRMPDKLKAIMLDARLAGELNGRPEEERPSVLPKIIFNPPETFYRRRGRDTRTLGNGGATGEGGEARLVDSDSDGR